MVGRLGGWLGECFQLGEHGTPVSPREEHYAGGFDAMNPPVPSGSMLRFWLVDENYGGASKGVNDRGGSGAGWPAGMLVSPRKKEVWDFNAGGEGRMDWLGGGKITNYELENGYRQMVLSYRVLMLSLWLLGRSQGEKYQLTGGGGGDYDGGMSGTTMRKRAAGWRW